MFESVDRKKAKLDSKRPLPPHTLRTLREQLIVNWTYHSNAIEGNPLTLSETKVVLEGITVGGKTIREHLEAINHKDAIMYVEDVVSKRESLTEWLIKNIHLLVLKGIQDQDAGIYRQENVLISGARHVPPDYIQVPNLMKNFIQKMANHTIPQHPIARAAEVHSEFVKIHPFVDGNGRTARLLLNFELMQAGYPPIVISKEQRLTYYEALDQAHTSGDTSVFISMITKIVEETLDFYLTLV